MEGDQQPQVSVVIPCYRQSQFLGEAIESVLNQTWQDFEILVVDDGSPDETSKIAAGYSRVRCIRQENQGISVARNTGLSASKGRFLVFLDADDHLLPEALEIGVRHLNDLPECVFVWGHSRHITVDGSPLVSRPKPDIDRDYYRELLRTNYIRTPAEVMYRRNIFDAVGGFNPSIRAGEEYDLHLRITRSFPVYCHGRTVAEYRVHNGNATRNTRVMLKDTLTVLRLQREYVKGNKEFEQAYAVGIKAWRQFLGGRLAAEAWEQLRKRDRWDEALRSLWALLQYYPIGLTRYVSGKLLRAVAKS